METLTGMIITLGLGVFVIAGIYQLGKPGNPIVPAADRSYNNTINSLFK